MITYKLACENGYTQTIKANCLLGAKRKATQISALHGVGGYSVTTPDGAIYKRKFWSAGNYYGWHKWARAN